MSSSHYFPAVTDHDIVLANDTVIGLGGKVESHDVQITPKTPILVLL